MDRDQKAYLKDRELTEADRVVLGLYERAAESIEWDESDEAILKLARGIHAEDEGEDQSDKAFVRAAEEIGFPVMVKAAAGGGGVFTVSTRSSDIR